MILVGRRQQQDKEIRQNAILVTAGYESIDLSCGWLGGGRGWGVWGGLEVGGGGVVGMGVFQNVRFLKFRDSKK